MTDRVVIDYTNHRGVRAERVIAPICIRFGESDWHPGSQWLLDAWDVEKGAGRTFAVKDVHGWRPASEETRP